ncbi:hypothetical protein [Chlamydia vaughanii]|uniref:hypothetical protein n=1 Tax=Chlamydia vaughanii TaxID=3112552 RepID=UPI0032B2E0FF
MSCLNLPEVNATLKPVSYEDLANDGQWEKGYASVRSSSSSRVRLEKYQVNRQARIACIALAALITLILLAALIGSLQAQAFAFTWVSIVVAIVVPTILLTGGICVLHRISQKVDVFSGTVIKPFGERIWAPIPLDCFVQKNGQEVVQERVQENFIDLSTLDESGSGVALVYLLPSGIDARVPTFVFPLLAAPFLVIFKMIYNLIRFLVIPFYIILQMIVQCFSKDKIAQEDRFIFKDIIRECTRSLVNLLRAPFYGTASMIAVFYGLLDPLAGRVAYACLERDWNDDVIRSRGIWLVLPQHNFNFEGGGSRLGLGQFSYYLIGCFQPLGMLFFKNGQVVCGTSTSAQYYPKRKLFIYPGISVVPFEEGAKAERVEAEGGGSIDLSRESEHVPVEEDGEETDKSNSDLDSQ